jgi:hypothetical protein
MAKKSRRRKRPAKTPKQAKDNSVGEPKPGRVPAEKLPPYGPGGVSESEDSLLSIPVTSFDLPPSVVTDAEAALHGLRRAMNFKEEFDAAWTHLARASGLSL